MNRHPLEFHCDLCRGPVDATIRERARHAWQPLIICERCVREADVKSTRHQPTLSAAS